MKPSTLLRSFLFIAGSSLLAITYAPAGIIYWDGPSSSWNTLTAWSTASGGATPNPGTIPGSADDAIFNITTVNGPITVTLDAAQAAQSLTFNQTGTTTFRANNASDLTARTLTIGSGGVTLNSAAGDVTFGNNAGTNGNVNLVLGASQTWTNNKTPSTVTQEFESLRLATGNINYGANTFTVDGIGVTGFTGATITGSGNFIKNGTGTVVFSAGTGDNVTAGFTGKININGGVARYQNANNLGTGNIEINGGVLEGRFTSNLTRTQGTGSNQIQFTGGVSGLSGQAGGSGTTTFDIGAITWTSSTFNPTQFVLQSGTTNTTGVGILSNTINLNGANRTIRSDQTGGLAAGGFGQFNGAISNGSITKEGIGTHVLSSASNSYAGGTTINAGTLRFDKKAAMPNAGAVTVNSGGILGIDLGTVAEDWSNGTSGNGSLGGLLAGLGGQAGGTVSYSGSVGLNLNLTADTSYSGSIANLGTTLAIHKTGANSLTLSASNTYTGGTFVNAGTLNLGHATDALANAGAVTVAGTSTLALGANSDTVGAVTLIAGTISSSTGVLTGSSYGVESGTITAILGGSGVMNKSTAGALHLNSANTFSGGVVMNAGTIYANNNASFGTGTLTINGGRIDIAQNATSAATTITTTNANTWNASWQMGRGTTGNAFWNNNGNVQLGGNITVSSANNQTHLSLGGVIDDGASSFGLTFNTNSATLSNANTYNGGTSFLTLLNINNGGSGGTSSAIGTGALNLAGGTIDNTSGSAVTLSTNNSLNITGNFAFGGSNDLNLGTGAITLTGTRTITSNGSAKLTLGGNVGAGANGFVKSGSGTLALTGASSAHSGRNTINTGILEISTMNNYSANSSLGAQGNADGLWIAGGATLRYVGSANVTTNRGFTLSSSGGSVIESSGLGTLSFGTAANTLAYNSTGTRTLVLGGTNIGDNTFGKILTNNGVDANSLTKTGSGKWILNQSNTYTGGTAINGGTLELGTSAIQALGGTGTVASVGTITFGGGTLRYGASNTTDYSSRFGTGVNQFSIDTNGLNVTFASQIIGTANASTFTKLGAGKLTLSSAVSRYAGVTTIGGGTLNANTLAVGGSDSSIGTSTNVAANLVIAGGTLQHDAANIASTDRLFTIGGTTGDTAALDSSAASTTHVMSFTNTGAVAFGNTNAHTLTLTGSNTGDNTFAPIIGNNTGATSLVKDGSGKWVLTGANTYTGATTVNQGTLLVNGSTASGSTVGVAAGAILGGTGTIGGAVNVTGSLSPGASIQTLGTGTLAFAAGSTLIHELDSSVATSVGSDLLKVSGNLNLVGTVGLTLDDLALTDVAFNLGAVFSLINYTGTWNNGLFTISGNELADEEVFTSGLNMWRISYNDTSGGLNYSGEYAGGSFVNLTAVPEPSLATLIGGFGVLALLRRRR